MTEMTAEQKRVKRNADRLRQRKAKAAREASARTASTSTDRRADARTKKDYREQKRDLVKRGLCRQCGKKRERGDKALSTVRCNRCHRKHKLAMIEYKHRPNKNRKAA